MKTNKNSIQRNFPYKNPQFGRVTKKKTPRFLEKNGLLLVVVLFKEKSGVFEVL
jgi:hypothetical protein